MNEKKKEKKIFQRIYNATNFLVFHINGVQGNPLKNTDFPTEYFYVI